MLSETLAEGLASYEIGPKVRTLRLGKKLALAQLGDHTGLSTAQLSKIERGQLFPTLPTLLRIAMVFGVGLDHFFAKAPDKPKVAVVRRAERIRFPHRAGSARPAYFFESLDFRATDRAMSAYYAEFEDLDAAECPAHEHNGEEFVYVLSGRLVIDVNGAEFELGVGDSVYFDGRCTHSYRRRGASRCAAIVVVAANGTTVPGPGKPSEPVPRG